MKPRLSCLLAAVSVAGQAGSAAATGYSYGRADASSLSFDGAGADGLAAAGVSPDGSLFALAPGQKLGSLMQPLGEGLALAAHAVKAERRHREGSGAAGGSSASAAGDRQWPPPAQPTDAAVPEGPEATGAEMAAREEPTLPASSLLVESPSDAMPSYAAGQKQASPLTFSATAASMRREPPPSWAKGDLAPDLFPGQAAEASLSEDLREARDSDATTSVAPTSDGDLSKELEKDARFLKRAARWRINLRVAMSFIGSIVLGVVAGVVIAVVLGALKAEDNSGVLLGQALVAISAVGLLGCISWAIYLVGDVLMNIETIGGQMTNYAVTRMGVQMLTRIDELETSAALADGVTWVMNATNPSKDPLTFTRIFTIVNMNDTAMMLIKSKPLPTEIPAETTVPLSLDVQPRPGNKIRESFRGLTFNDRQWAQTFARESFDMSVEGKFRDKDFAVTAVCKLPLRLADLPLPATWPTGLDLAMVERSVTAGLADAHSDSGSLVSAPAASKSILDYKTLSVTGPLASWFRIMLRSLSFLSAPFAACLALGGLLLAGGLGKPPPKGASAAEDKTDDAAAVPADPPAPGATAPPDNSKPLEKAAASPPPPAAASPPAPAAASSPPPAAASAPPPAAASTPPVRSTRSRAAQQAKAAPAPAPAAGADEDEHEF